MDKDKITIGSYIVFKHALAYADLEFGWREETRHYDHGGNFPVFSHATFKNMTGIKLVFTSGQVLTFPDSMPETATLRAWLTGQEAGPAGLSPAQAEVVEGLPTELAELFKVKQERLDT